MGAWSTSITGNDTAKDLYIEYCAAFYQYDVQEALKRIDRYVRDELFDESDQEEWCNYFYSLADFMWKKGILTDSVREKAVEMIDSGFGLALWEEAGQKTLNSRKKKLELLRNKLLSPQPPKKKIRPDVHTQRIFEAGDIVAVALQTAGKPYTEAGQRPLSDDEFHALDGKYVLMQLIDCTASRSSSIVPEIKDYWAHFRLFDGIYDTVPDKLDFSSVPDASLHQRQRISPYFTCESNMFYFKKRNFKVIGNFKELLAGVTLRDDNTIFWSINKPWLNPDSQLVAALGKKTVCEEFKGSFGQVQDIVRLSNRYGRMNLLPPGEMGEAILNAEETLITQQIENALSHGGTLYSLSFGKTIGIVTVQNHHISNLMIEGHYQSNGFGTKLLEYAFCVAGKDAYMDVPEGHTALRHICEKLGLKEKPSEEQGFVRVFRG